MTSYNSEANKEFNPNPMSNILKATNLNQTDNALKQFPNNNVFHKKQLLSTKAFIILGISFILIVAILTIILVLALGKNKTKRPFRVPIKSTDIVETTNIIIQTTQVSTTYHIENDAIISYEEAEKIIGIENTKKTHELLNKTSNNLGELISNVSKAISNLSFVNETIVELPKNLDFLKNTNDSALLVAKEDLDLYMESFSAIPEQINNLTGEISIIMKNVSDSLIQYKNI